MIPYWTLFLVPALIAMSSPPTRRVRRDGTRFNRFDGAWLLVIIALTLMIGLRYRVGGDWGAYFTYLDEARSMSLAETIFQDDPGYRLLNELGLLTGLNMVLVNAVSGLLFTVGLVAFCRSMPRPWLAFTVAVPYLVVVVSMGYTRQSVAIGLVMLGLVALGRQRAMSFIFWTLIAALFHKSAIILLPTVALTATRNRWLIILLVGIIGSIGYQVVLADSTARLVENYIGANLVSTGALIRLTMNVVPALLFLYYRKRLRIAPAEYKVWRLFALISVGLFVGYFTTGASTALDRIALYMIPLQLFAFSHLPDLMGRYNRMNQSIVLMVLAYSALILFVWLFFGNFSRAWLPYRVWLG
ncbi:EpsG family protein [Salibaculum sp.]|uniref:EpsG family protein n=1 Tax=Salibaculum sp. TaxID=2855480 RepID=UPI002B476FD2|nr:EpsG family protein [Salibaculum sp.]HKL69579.1 EpsG family protein [Salibaculum sp.]